ncbi:MAG: CoA transferase, partial [Burkholderiales bacterium]|nr:CoA transferase [Burkholderiales bacterium]
MGQWRAGRRRRRHPAGSAQRGSGIARVRSVSGALAGLRVVELGTLIAGPFCARILAEFGAEVIKIEAPEGGDPLRRWRKLHQGTSLWWSVQARNKKSVTANLRLPAGQEVVRRLVQKADIVVENFRPGALEKWGLGWEQLSALNPGLIMVRLSGYGQSGPYRDQPGFGAIGEAMGGIRFVTGYPDRPPVRAGISLGDSVAAMYGAIGALIALHARSRNGGRGQVVDVALYEAVFSLMESMLPEYDVAGFVRERSGAALPGIVPSNTYTTRDGKYLVIGANGDSIFKRFMLAIGREDLAHDATLADNAGRVQRAEELEAVIAAWAASVDLEQALTLLARAEVPAGKIYDVADIARDVHYRA